MQPSFFENLGSVGHNNIAVIVQKESELKDLFGCVFFFSFFVMMITAGCVNQPVCA